jgi:hypothetical protein
MGRELTPDQTKQECIAMMGSDLGELYYYLWQELSILYSKWNEFVELYVKKQSRIELMNNTSPSFLRIVEDILWENIALGISKITDPSQTFGKDNLTICKIPDLLPDTDFKMEIILAIDKAKLSAQFSRDWRNRKISHSDYLLKTGKATKQLESATKDKIDEALISIAEVLNLISTKYKNSTTSFEFVIESYGNANTLLYYLYYGLKAVKEREDRIRQELPGDFDEPDI